MASTEAPAADITPAAGKPQRQQLRHIYIVGGLGTLSFAVISFIVCTSNLGDAAMTALYEAKVDPEAYLVPACCFTTAFCLNCMTMLFELESQKFKLAFLGAYIQLLAAVNDYLSWMGYAPVMYCRGSGRGIHVLRYIMWAHTTPVMVYLLSMLSDFNRKKVAVVIASDIVMIAFGLLGDVTRNLLISVPCSMVAFLVYPFVIFSLWTMFDAAIDQAQNYSNRFNLQMLRIFTVGFWITFPVIWLMLRFGLVDVRVEEWLWTTCDFCGKVMFSSSLLYGNFLTIEQRKLIAMRIVEESNKIQVIKELRDLVEQKETFMSSMSHELRTPLNGIIGLSDAVLIGSCGPINESVAKTVGNIKTSGSRLLNLINDILDAASMRQGTLVVRHEKVNLSELVDDVVELCAPLTKRNVKLVNNISPSCPAVLGDAGRIIQIFHNLIGNSCKFTHKGQIWVAATVKGEWVEVSVNDNGIGIPEEKFDKIFLAFEQVDMSTTRKYGGTGLGLNLVKQLVEAHGGTVRVASVMDECTSFFFRLKIWDKAPEAAYASPRISQEILRAEPAKQKPGLVGALIKASKKVGRTLSYSNLSSRVDAAAAEAGSETAATEAAAAAAAAAAAEAAALTAAKDAKLAQDERYTKGRVRRRSKSEKIHVLSVDDDPINQMVIQNLLGPEGYEVTQAMDGQEALLLLEEAEQLPDVILLDVMMPGMSGHEVCRKLRELYPLSCIPVIMISAKTQEEHIVEGLASGSNDYVSKPFGRQEILMRITAHLRFRDSVYLAGTLSADELADCKITDLPAQIMSLLDMKSVQFSLPHCIKHQIETTNQQNSLQTFDQLTMVAAQICNLAELVNGLPAETILSSLVSLYIAIGELLTKHNCYLVDSVEGHIVVVAGLTGAKGKQQVEDAVAFAQELLVAAGKINLSHNISLELSMGIHTCATQGVVVGTIHPIMNFTGNLPNIASKLQLTCPPGCIHVSSQARDLRGTPDDFVLALDSAKHGSYLLKAGNWEKGRQEVQASVDRYLSEHPFGPIHTTSPQLRPIQLALVALVIHDPGMLMLMLQTSSNKAKGSDSGSDPAAPERPVESAASQSQLAELQHEKEMVERQLEEVSVECDRLQTLVDEYEAQAKQGPGASSGEASEGAGAAAAAAAAAAAKEEAAKLQARCQELEVKLQAALQEKQLLLGYLEELEMQMMDLREKVKDLQEELRVAKQKQQEQQSLQQPQPQPQTMSPRNPRRLPGRQPSNLGLSPPTFASSDLPLPSNRASPQVSSHVKRSPSETSGCSSLVDVAATEARLINKFGDTFNEWGMKDLLHELGLGHLAARFEAEEITPAMLPHFDDRALRDLGVTTVGAKLKIRAAAAAIAGDLASMQMQSDMLDRE